MSTVHLGVMVVGGLYLSLDRRLLIANTITWLAWLAAIAIAWIPQGQGLPVLIICLISAVGGAMLRKMRIASIEEVIALKQKLERASREREQALSRIQETEKLESLGVMAAGVAHDYNNLLVGVVGGADLAASAHTAEEQDLAIRTIRRSAESLAGLSAQLLEFSGGRPISREVTDLNKLVEQTLTALAIDQTVSDRISRSLDPNLPWVNCEPQSLKQVVLNLVSNAIQAASNEPGAIVVGTRSAVADQQQPVAILWVSDDGPGVPDSLKPRIFDPFFTTKETGHGLGLATTRTIVARHDGEIHLCEQAGGARFEVKLPGLLRAAEPRQTAEVMPSAATASTTGGSLLLVDDDSPVREVTTLMLSHLGFTVVQAASGEQAIELLKRTEPVPVAAVVDAIMPGLDGPETIRRMRQLEPQLPIVLYSGYHYAADEASNLPDNVRFLAKPFSTQTLRGALESLIPVPASTAK